MNSTGLGKVQTGGCAPRTPTYYDIFGCQHQSRPVLARGEQAYNPPKLVRPDANHSPKREHNCHNICRHELKLHISGKAHMGGQLAVLQFSSSLSSSSAVRANTGLCQ